MTKILVVNKKDEVIGVEEKKSARAKGLIHRIVRVFLFNSKNQLFLQKCAASMDTYPNCWDQSVGGHVDEGEDYNQAALRETEEELGIEFLELKRVLRFYNEENVKGEILRRFNVLYKGIYDGVISINKSEVSKGKWFNLEELEVWMKKKPDDFAPGFIKAYQEYQKIKEDDRF